MRFLLWFFFVISVKIQIMTRLILTFLILDMCFSACHPQKNSSRITIPFNSSWTFTYSPGQEVEQPFTGSEFDDKDWIEVGLPHTWQTYETTGDLHPFIKNASERDDPYWWKGWGYYRKKFTIDESLRNKLVTLELDGVQKYSRIYLNDTFVGDHKGGFTSFYFDLTPFLKWGEENTIVIAVNNRRDDKYRIPPMTAGNWNVYGGIYRDVRLVIKNKIHIPFQGSYQHEGGTFISTPEVSHDRAVAHIKTFVRNRTGQKTPVMLKTTLYAPNGKKLEVTSMQEMIGPGEIQRFSQSLSPVQNPELWHPDSPGLYRITSSVFVNDTLTDQTESTFGFRWFHWDYEKNDLWLNGEKLPIRGFNRHQEYPWIGDAIPKWLTLKDFTDMKENLGINFFRAAHYPNDPQVYRLADSLGMVAVEEVPNIKSIDFDEEVQEQHVREMIRRDRNHPSILFWSVGNETTDAADSKWVMEEDTTRIIHARKAEEYGDFVEHDHTNLDMENLLRVTIRGFFDQASAPAGRNLKPADGQHCSLEEWQHQMAMKEGGSVRGSLKKNTVLWLYEDHGADREYKNSPLKHVNYKGWVDLYRFPKYVYFLTQAMYTQKPMVFIHKHNWVPEYLGQKKNITVNSNCEKVELFCNNQKIGEKYPDYTNYYTVEFENVTVQEGTLRVEGKSRGKTVEDKVMLHGKPALLSLSVSHTRLTAGKSDVALVTADVTDMKGNRIIQAHPPLTWTVSGAASLVGPSLYTTDFDLFEAMEGTGYIRVPVSNVVRSSSQPGTATVTVSSPGLKPASVKIQVLPGYDAHTLVRQSKVNRDPSIKVMRLVGYRQALTREIILQPISGNRNFNISDSILFMKEVTGFLVKNNPEFDPVLPESKILIDHLCHIIKRLNGEMIGDDFNFIATAYNDCRYFSRAMDQSNFNHTLSNLLITELAQRMIVKGEQADVEKEASLFIRLPEKRKMFRLEKNYGKGDPWINDKEINGIFTCYITHFEDLLQQAWPEIIRMSDSRIKDYLGYVDAINPHLQLINGKMIMEKQGLFCLPDPVNTIKE